MNRWKFYSIIIMAAAFVAVNIYLTVKDNSKVARTAYVNEWMEVKRGDIVETFQSKGVVTPKEESPIYYGKENNEFQKFLVREGDEVSAGTPLFEYATPELDALRTAMEAQKIQVEGEIAGIDEYIAKLESYQPTITDASSSTSSDTGLEAQPDLADAASGVIKSTIKQEIYKQEMEKGKLEEQITKLDTQLSNIHAGGTATVASESEGFVKEVDYSLGDPIITIASKESDIEGFFNEKQLKQAKPGMKIKITSPDLKKPLNGTIEQINTIPEEEPDVKMGGTYEYKAAMEKESSKLVKGSKVAITVITREAKGVPAIPETAIRKKKGKPFIYRLTAKGYMQMQSIDKGLGFAGKREVAKGVKQGDVIVRSPDHTGFSQSRFITPLDTQEASKSVFKKMPNSEKFRYILVGLLEQ
ncbi:efflux RND transporter periplasmic adaptor subunit [Peribacillus glennii]|uniref:Efflux RND transporter periplasmic adaptor subunit n=1 Tax=Peribacillus glennii TaxID=2303991 RepID=A0A372L6I7_9BACI|nr:efflux RND transporter periplasmic adaptor subunit [Peribacillus glennii]RFU60662.1 efflux RND transporter periplasmic adaptor subunit [Peribacillus glennii]